jgi:arylsulfatase A-like enzyme
MKRIVPLVLAIVGSLSAAETRRPNILFLISDDQSWLHTGVSGCKGVQTPNFDRVAKQGVLFTQAFCSSPGCAPSRGAILSGQDFWRLREGSVQRSTFPADIRSYPEILEAAGYHVGVQGKGWGPGRLLQSKGKGKQEDRPLWRKKSLAGKDYKNFDQFHASVPAGKPFCFWFGSIDPHRPYAPGSGLKAGKRLDDVDVPPFLPDVPEVRSDLLDYFAEIDRFDRGVGQILDELEKSGQAADTLVFITSDNGMPFPRAKANLYDAGVRMPLAVRWPARVKSGRVVDDFISLADCAPTILRAAGLAPPPEMSARSFLDVLLSEKSGRVDPVRDHAVFGRERHGVSWPSRALRNDRYLYIRNFAPDRLDGLDSQDSSPSKTFMIEHANDSAYRTFYELALGPRPAEELYDVRNDADQIHNLSAQPEHAAALEQLRKMLEAELKRKEDPRMLGRGSEFDNYPGAASKPAPAAVKATVTAAAKPPAAQPKPAPAAVKAAETAADKQPAPTSKTTPVQAPGKGRVQYDCDVAVIGGGSGGFGAALAAARLGCDVVLVEKAGCLGGTSVNAGVHCWEMGAGGSGIPFDLYKELKRQTNAVAIYSIGRHGSTFDPSREAFRFPGGEAVVDPDARYLDTLQRHVPRGQKNTWAYRRKHWHGVLFEPEAISRTMQAMLDATGHGRVLLNTAFVSAEAGGGRVRSVQLSDGSRLRARSFIDTTGGGLVCLSAGCQSMMGQEPRERFSEPNAPEEATELINGVSLIYRVTPVKEPQIEPLAKNVPATCWWQKRFPGARVNHYPGGDLNVNMLPTLDGAEFLKLGYDAAYTECRRRVLAHWHSWQTRFEEFRGFRLAWIAPALGIRESRRIVGEYVLNENDLRAGLSGQKHPDIICLADHSFDSHGGHAKHGGELTEPYGVPYRCLIPQGFSNLLVACRASSFSSLAASSCRLSRTMMQLGQAAGTAASLAKELNVDLPAVPPDRLRAALRQQHVQLEHPMTDEMRAYLTNQAQ